MEGKYKEYEKFDWTLNDKWQIYLNNIYPVPPRDRLLKMRKKWYRDNVDKDFDINYEPSSNEGSSQPSGNQSQSNYQQYMNQQYQQQHQQSHDTLPHLKDIQAYLWIGFLVSLPLRLYSGWIALAALVVGLSKRYGWPKLNKLYLQRVIFDENFQMIPYLGSVSMLGGLNFVLYMPILLHAYLETAATFKAKLDTNPNLFPLSYFKDFIQKGVQFRSQFVEMKADVEIYIGIYLVAVWFIGWSNFITIFLYWQLLRMRYMLNTNLQAGFRRVDAKIQTYTISYGFVHNIYLKIRGLMASMSEMDRPGQEGQGGRGGLLSRCDIF